MTVKEKKALGYIQCSGCKKHKPKTDYYAHDDGTYSCKCGLVFHPDWRERERKAYKEFMNS